MRLGEVNPLVQVERWVLPAPKSWISDRRAAEALGLRFRDPVVCGVPTPLSVGWRLVESPRVVKQVVTPLPVTRHMLQTLWEKIDPDISRLPDWVWDQWVLPQYGIWTGDIKMMGTNASRFMPWPTLLPSRDKIAIVRPLAHFYDLSMSQRAWCWLGAPIIPPYSNLSRIRFHRRFGHLRVIWAKDGFEAKPTLAHQIESSLDLTHHKIDQYDKNLRDRLDVAIQTLSMAKNQIADA
jgi:hypothetical protein